MGNTHGRLVCIGCQSFQLYFPKNKLRQIGAPQTNIQFGNRRERGSLSSVFEPNIRFTLKPNRRQKSDSVYPARGPFLILLLLLFSDFTCVSKKKKKQLFPGNGEQFLCVLTGGRTSNRRYTVCLIRLRCGRVGH